MYVMTSPGSYALHADQIDTVKLPPPPAPSERTQIARKLSGLSKAVKAGYGDLAALQQLLSTLKV